MKDDEIRIPVAEALNNPTRPRIALGLPTRDEVKMDYCLSLMGMCVDMSLFATFIPLNPRSCYIQCNRNDIVKEALAQGAHWIMWVDADIEFPQDGLRRLLTHQVPIVGATYARRAPPYQLMGAAVDRSKSLPMEGLAEMLHIPAGFMLTSTDVFRKLTPPWFWVTHHANGEADLGDDYYFCAKAREAGYSVLCDTRLSSELRHHADIGLGPSQAPFPGGR